MSSRHALFEVSFEVCNKVGGIYTVLATKAQTLAERFGEDYLCIGPWLLRDDEQRPIPFEAESGFEDFEEACRAAGLPVQVGRWTIPGRPRTVLVEFSSLYEQKDDVLAGLWEKFGVDSLHGDWDYIEPVLFGHAAGQIIERWWEQYQAPQHQRAVAHFHEWMTGSGALYIKRRCPGIGTVFTTHATMLGRALSSLGRSPEDGLGEDTPEQLAEQHGVVAKHSLEGICAREADVFTTVSEITATEAELLHRRRPEPLLLNGIDLNVIDTMAAVEDRATARARLEQLAGCFLDQDVSQACFLAVSGRYEFHNKGIDVLLDACADLNAKPGKPLVLFVLVPAGHSGLRADLRERWLANQESRERPEGAPIGPLGLATHHLYDESDDPVQKHCQERGLDNAVEARVKVVQVPIYLSEHDDFLQLPYEAVLRAMDLSCFPSYYEPWGYTPQESLAVGVPTITSDYAGFGRWVRSQELGIDDGVTVITRQRRTYQEVREELTATLERFLEADRESFQQVAEVCRTTAARTAWSDFIQNYLAAYERAMAAVQSRLEQGFPLLRRPKQPLAVNGESHAPQLTRFDVSASLPPELAPLATLARNYAWCWDPEGMQLFAELSPESWRQAGRNPIVFLNRVFEQDLSAKANDKAFVAKLQGVAARIEQQLAKQPEAAGHAVSAENPVAYFSAEFGIHESLRIYSGGLGILAGDHLKSASDVGLPLVGVGLFYSKGYMSQRFTAEGDQLALDLSNDPRDLPMERVRGADGQTLELRLRLPGRDLFVQAWCVPVGRVRLFLLDANLPANRAEDRDITRNLYGGDETMRIRQELVLGRGGARLLRRLGIRPSVWHMNEGHAAFLSLERVARLLRDEGLTFEEAREVVRSTTVFTTHTPVPAGHDRFTEDLMRKYFSDVDEWLGVSWERFLELGRDRAADEGADFNMTHLAMQFASKVNGVSRIHGAVSRGMFQRTWPGLIEQEVPIASITNGIHLPTWVRPQLAALVGAADHPVRGEDFQSKAPGIRSKELWAVRRQAKRDLLERLDTKLERSFVERNDSPALLSQIRDGLDAEALWIGFARRFAPYKRAHLVFKDRDRLRALLDGAQRPVRLLVAGKAHPRDSRGQEIVKEIALIARSPEFAGRVILIEDYDVGLARAMVQGVDVWLNTPTRPLEASGTSGMKAAANGVLNLSVGDGWWPEGADGRNGWTIGGERTYQEQELQDQLDSETLYRLLEEEVVPLYYERSGKLPEAWLERMRHALATLPAIFNTDRMVLEYAERAYYPLAEIGARYFDDNYASARDRAARKARLREHFSELQVKSARVSDLSSVRAGDHVEVHVELDLAEVPAQDVQVELVLGHASEHEDPVRLQSAITVPLASTPSMTNGLQAYEGSHRLERSGAYAYGLRVRASDDLADPGDVLRDLVRWVN